MGQQAAWDRGLPRKGATSPPSAWITLRREDHLKLLRVDRESVSFCDPSQSCLIPCLLDCFLISPPPPRPPERQTIKSEAAPCSLVSALFPDVQQSRVPVTGEEGN